MAVTSPNTGLWKTEFYVTDLENDDPGFPNNKRIQSRNLSLDQCVAAILTIPKLQKLLFAGLDELKVEQDTQTICIVSLRSLAKHYRYLARIKSSGSSAKSPSARASSSDMTINLRYNGYDLPYVIHSQETIDSQIVTRKNRPVSSALQFLRFLVALKDKLVIENTEKRFIITPNKVRHADYSFFYIDDYMVRLSKLAVSDIVPTIQTGPTCWLHATHHFLTYDPDIAGMIQNKLNLSVCRRRSQPGKIISKTLMERRLSMYNFTYEKNISPRSGKDCNEFKQVLKDYMKYLYETNLSYSLSHFTTDAKTISLSTQKVGNEDVAVFVNKDCTYFVTSKASLCKIPSQFISRDGNEYILTSCVIAMNTWIKNDYSDTTQEVHSVTGIVDNQQWYILNSWKDEQGLPAHAYEYNWKQMTSDKVIIGGQTIEGDLAKWIHQSRVEAHMSYSYLLAVMYKRVNVKSTPLSPPMPLVQEPVSGLFDPTARVISRRDLFASTHVAPGHQRRSAITQTRGSQSRSFKKRQSQQNPALAALDSIQRSAKNPRKTSMSPVSLVI